MSVINVGKKILIIDDEPQLLYLMKVFLQDAGFEVVVCNAPAKATEVIKNEKVDAVVCDYLMPKFNGLECIQEIRKIYGSTVPVVVCTAVHHLTLEQVKAVGGNDIVRKPVDFTTLASILDREFALLKKGGEQNKTLASSFLLSADRKRKTNIKLIKTADHQLVIETSPQLCQKGESHFFEFSVSTKTEDHFFPCKGKVIDVSPSLVGKEELVTIELEIFDAESFEKIAQFYLKNKTT